MLNSIIFLTFTILISAQESKRILLCNILENKVEIVELINDSNKIIYSSQKKDTIPISCKGDYVLFNTPGIALYNLKDQSVFNLQEKSYKYFIGGLYKNQDILYYSRQKDSIAEPEIVLYDYKNKKIIKLIEGYDPKLSTKEDCLYFLKAKSDSSKSEIKDFRYIYKYQFDLDKVSRLKTFELDGYNIGEITEVVGINDNDFVYGVYNEHEIRYFNNVSGKMKEFYSGGHGHSLDGINKEQFDLCFSPNNEYAAFSERNWNELTYMVLIDLVNKKRHEIKKYGAFPYLTNEKMYFISEPEMVETKNIEFRQIKNYVLYSLDLKTEKVEQVIDLDGGIYIIE